MRTPILSIAQKELTAVYYGAKLEDFGSFESQRPAAFVSGTTCG